MAHLSGLERKWPASRRSYPPSLHLHVRTVTADGIGSEVELRPRGGRAFRCRVESLEAPRRLRLRYPGDFIVGTGEWRLDAAPGGTRMAYELDVVATGRLAVLLGWLLLLGKIHSKFMREVLASLEQETSRRARWGKEEARGSNHLLQIQAARRPRGQSLWRPQPGLFVRGDGELRQLTVLLTPNKISPCPPPSNQNPMMIF